MRLPIEAALARGLRKHWLEDKAEFRNGRDKVIGASEIGGCPVRVLHSKMDPDMHDAMAKEPDERAKGRLLVGKLAERQLIAAIMDGLGELGWKVHLPTHDTRLRNKEFSVNVPAPDLVLVDDFDDESCFIAEMKTMKHALVEKLKKAALAEASLFKALYIHHPKYAFQVVNQIMVYRQYYKGVHGSVYILDRDNMATLEIPVPDGDDEIVRGIEESIKSMLMWMSQVLSLPKEEGMASIGVEKLSTMAQLLIKPEYHECRSCPLMGKQCEGFSRQGKQEAESGADATNNLSGLSDPDLVNLYEDLKKVASVAKRQAEEAKDEAIRRIKANGGPGAHIGQPGHRLTLVSSQRISFDSAAFKEAMPGMYARFNKVTIYETLKEEP